MSEILDPYAAWKNIIRKLGKIEALEVIWAYHVFNAFNAQFPEEIIPPQEFCNEGNRGMRYISAFFLISYTRDILAYGGSRQQYSIKDGSQFGFLQNLANQLTAGGIIDDENETRALSLRLFQIAHQQFKWQVIQSDYRFYLNTYSFLYKDDSIKDLITSFLGFPCEKILDTGYIFAAGFICNFRVRINDDLVGNEDLEAFLNIFGNTLNFSSTEMRTALKTNFSFEFSGIKNLLNTPIIILDNGDYICPLPLLLFRSIFEGTYFKCISNGAITSRFGLIFQQLCGNIITSGLAGGKLKLLTDDILLASLPNVKNLPSNPDFLIEEENCILFLDAKFSSVPENLFMNVKSIENLNFGKFISIIKQGFSFVENYRKSIYSGVIKNSGLKEFVIFLVPFDTFFSFGVSPYTPMDEMIKLMKDSGDFQDIDFMFMGINELHRFIQLGSKYGFREILDMKFNEKFRSYEMLGFMNEITENGYVLEYSQYDFGGYDFMSEIETKYKPV